MAKPRISDNYLSGPNRDGDFLLPGEYIRADRFWKTKTMNRGIAARSRGMESWA
jgi:hypothetical protein